MAGERLIALPLPRVGWFPDEDLPPPLPGDPADEVPTTTADTPMAQRLAVINAVLGASSP